MTVIGTMPLFETILCHKLLMRVTMSSCATDVSLKVFGFFESLCCYDKCVEETILRGCKECLRPSKDRWKARK
jgi:hypothetical protein